MEMHNGLRAVLLLISIMPTAVPMVYPLTLPEMFFLQVTLAQPQLPSGPSRSTIQQTMGAVISSLQNLMPMEMQCGHHRLWVMIMMVVLVSPLIYRTTCMFQDSTVHHHSNLRMTRFTMSAVQICSLQNMI